MIPTGHRFSRQSNGFKSWKWRYATYLPISGMCLEYLRSLQQKHNAGHFLVHLHFDEYNLCIYIHHICTPPGFGTNTKLKKCWQSNMDTVLWFKSYIWLTSRYLGFHVLSRFELSIQETCSVPHKDCKAVQTLESLKLWICWLMNEEEP